MLKLLSTFSFYHARREAHSCFLSCEFLVESRASRRENPRKRVPSNEYQFARGCAAIVIARVLKQYPELSRDSASTIPGKAPIRARKPKSGSRGEIITWARSISRSALDLAPSRVLASCFSTHCLYAWGSFPFDISNSSEAFSTTRIPGKQPREIYRSDISRLLGKTTMIASSLRENETTKRKVLSRRTPPRVTRAHV